MQSLLHTYQRYRTLQTHKITALPIVILMPHSACNCRCVMCDIWKDNTNLKQLKEDDIKGLLASLRQLGTKQVVMSGGEALLNANFFRLCELLRNENISVTLLSTGLLLEKHKENVLEFVKEVIVSLDGDKATHDAIRNVPGAFQKLQQGVVQLKSSRSNYRITARTVIHKLNFRNWPKIIDAALEMGLDQISFLPADVSSQAFNRESRWDVPRQQEVMPRKEDMPELINVIEAIIATKWKSIENRFVAESADKLRKIGQYYGALHGLNPFPFKKCNAPWVSTVIEADGTVRPCFFHQSIGNIREQSLSEILNAPEAVKFRRGLNMDTNDTCLRCVCYLNLKPTVNVS